MTRDEMLGKVAKVLSNETGMEVADDIYLWWVREAYRIREEP